MLLAHVFAAAHGFALIGLAACLGCTYAHAVALGTGDPALSTASVPEASAPSPGVIPNPSAEIKTIQAINALYLGVWDEALGLAATAITRGTQDIDALGAFAVAGVILGDRPVVEKALPKLLETEYPAHYSVIVQGILALQRGDAGAAEAYLGRVLEKKPNETLALYFRGETEHVRGDTATALTTFRQVAETAPEFAPALAAIARLLPEDQSKESIALMERAVAIHPANVAYRRHLADLYAKAGRQEDANRLYTEILRAIPGVKDQYLTTAWQLQRTGRPGEALKQVEKAVKHWGWTPLGSLVSAMASVDLGEEKQARKHLTDYLAGADDKAQAHLAAGLCFLALGDATGAQEQFNESLLLQPDNPQALANLAVATQMDRDMGASKETLRKAERSSEGAEVTAFVGMNLEFAMGDSPAYKQHWTAMESLFPGAENLKSPVAGIPADVRERVALQRNVMLVMFLNQWHTQTVRYADLTMLTLPGDAISGYLRALALELQDKPEEARGTLEKLVASEPRFTGAQLALGRMAARLNDPETALSAYSKAEELAPRSIPAKLGIASALLALRQTEAATNALIGAENQANSGRELFQVALAYRQMGKFKKFRALTERALAKGDTGIWRQQAASFLAATQE